MSPSPDSPLDPGYVDPVMAERIRRMRLGRDVDARLPGAAGPGFSPIQPDGQFQEPLPAGAMQPPQASGTMGQGTGQPQAPPSRARMAPPGSSPVAPQTGGAPPPATGAAPASAAPAARQTPPGVNYAAQMQPLAERQAALSTPVGSTTPSGAPGERPVLQSKGVGGALQRVAMALLSATKMAPYAQMIVHPQFTQQLASNQVQLEGIKDQLGTMKEESAAQEQQERGGYYADLPQARVQAAAERAEATKAAAKTREDEADLLRRQNAFKAALGGQQPLYLTPEKPAPEGWEQLPVQDPNMPDNVRAWVPSSLAILPETLQPFLPQYKTGQQIPRAELNAAVGKYQTQLEQTAVKAATHTNEPIDQQFVEEYLQKHPGSTKADAIAAYKQIPSADKPKEATPPMMIGPDRKAFEVRPGVTVPEGSVTPGGESSMTVPTAATRGMAEKAPRVVQFVDRINQLLDANEKQLGPLASRWNEFTAGRIGLPNQGYTQLRTDAGLLETALMNMHVGARGGERIMEHFHNLINTSTQSPENLRAALGEIRTYAQQVAQEGGPKGAAAPPAASGGGAKTYTQADVAAAVQSHPGLTANQAEAAFNAKGWVKK